nr:AAA family ATPase [Nannocystis pusilla]
MVVTITGLGAAKDRVTHAARFALSLRDLVGERQIVLTTGSVEDTAGNGVGDAIERAVRRLARCPTGPGDGPPPIAIDKSTAALLDHRFEWHDSAAGPELWGERGSVDVVRNLLGRPAPCVGRERDLSTLTEAFRDCVDESLAQAVLLVAPAGVGKSRLSQEFVRSARVRGPVEVWTAQGDPFRVDSSLMLLGGALRSAVGIAGAEPMPERHARLRAAVAGLLPAAEQRRIAEFIGEIVGAPFPDDDSPQLRAARHDAAAMTEQMQQALGEFVAARCRRGPVMLVLEELHWSDAMSARFVDTLLRDLAELPLFVLALARPEVGERFPTLWSARRLQQIRLGPLSRRASERLVRQVLGADIDAATCERLVDKAEGNAFYLEELIRAIAEGQTALPDTVIAMAQSRIEGLELELRRTLRAASVFGSVFWSGGVRALLGEDTSTRAVDGWLTRLVEREFLVRRKQSRFAGEDELEFRHALLREGAYSMLTDEDRRLGHEIAAAWLQQYDDVDARVLAEHCERSEQRERAVHFYMLAAEESWDNNDPDAAGPCAERGLQLGADGETRGVLLSVLAGVRSRQERHDESEAHCTEALALLPPGSRRWVRTFHVLFPVVARTRPARLGELLHAFFDIEPEPGTRAEQIHAVTWIYAILTITGVLDASATLLADMRRTFRAIERPDVLTRAFMDAAESVHADLVAGSPWQHMIRSRDSALAFQEVGLRGYQCIQASFYGKALGELGDHATATSILRDNLATAERFGDPVSLSYARLFLARLLLSAAAEPPLDEVVALATEVVAARNESLVGLALAALADCKLRRGDLADAEVDARLACERTRPFAGYWWGTAALHGRILLALGRPAEALAVLDDAMARLDELDMGGYGDIELCLVAAEVWHDHQRREPARRALAQAVQRLRARVDGLLPEHRRAYLMHVAPHARALALAGEWLGPDALTGLEAPA